MIKPVMLFLLILFSFAAIAQQKEIYEGNLFYLQMQYQKAEEKYKLALKKESNNRTALFNLSNALYKQKRFSESAKISAGLAASSIGKTEKANSFYNQGVAETRMKNVEASIESYKNALRQDPNDRQARENLQKALRELQQKQNQNQQKQKSRMSQREADQKLKLLQQKEKQIQQRLQNKARQNGNAGGRDW